MPSIRTAISDLATDSTSARKYVPPRHQQLGSPYSSGTHAHHHRPMLNSSWSGGLLRPLFRCRLLGGPARRAEFRRQGRTQEGAPHMQVLVLHVQQCSALLETHTSPTDCGHRYVQPLNGTCVSPSLSRVLVARGVLRERPWTPQMQTS